MVGLDHGSQLPPEQEHTATITRNTRYGLVLFVVYLILYGGFVLMNAFAPQQMEQKPVAGVNLAILYGFGLIAAAFVLAMIYGWLCRRPAGERQEESLR